MRRRDFIAGICGAATMPIVTRAQQAYAQQSDIRLIGGMFAGPENDREQQARVTMFRRELARLGWSEGKNVRFEFHWPGFAADRINTSAAELVALRPDLVLTGLTPGVAALQRLTKTIPIVFANIADPVGSGLIPSLANHGLNATGFTALEYTMAGKWLELVKELAPRVERVAFLHNPDIVFTGSFFRSLAAAAPNFAVEPIASGVRNAADIARTLVALEKQPNIGLTVAPEPTISSNRKLVIEWTARNAVPAVFPFSFYPREGGLASYGSDQVDQYRLAAGYVDRILRGAKASELPVQTPTKFELVVNLKTAKALGLSIPPSLLARADEVIE